MSSLEARVGLYNVIPRRGGLGRDQRYNGNVDFEVSIQYSSSGWFGRMVFPLRARRIVIFVWCDNPG